MGRLIHNSLLVSLLTYLSEQFRALVGGSFLSRIFNCSAAADQSASNSLTAGAARKLVASAAGGIRHGFASGVESSMLVGLYRRFCGAVLSASVRSAGVFFVSAAFYSAIAAGVHILSGDAAVTFVTDIITIALMLVLGLAMLASGKTLGKKTCESAILSFVLFDLLGINRMAVKTDAAPVHRFAFAFFAGLAFGAVSYFASALSVLWFAVAAVFFAVILYSPESGLLASMILIAVSGMDKIYIVLMATLFSYALKLLRGKRSLTLKSEDIFALFALLVFVIAFPAATPARTAVIAAAYFMTCNLLRTVSLLRKSAVCVSLGLGINMLYRTASSITGLFGISIGSVTGITAERFTAEDPLLVTISVIWMLCVMRGGDYVMPPVLKVIFASCAVFSAAFSASDPVIIAALAGAFIYFAFCSGRLFNVAFSYLILVPAVLCLRHIGAGGVTFVSVNILPVELSGVSTVNLLFGGAGCGEGLYASLVSAFGLLGCLLFAAMLFMLLSRANVSASADGGAMRSFCAASVAATAVFLILGCVSDTLGGDRELLTFWIFCGMISAAGNAIRAVTGEEYL